MEPSSSSYASSFEFEPHVPPDMRPMLMTAAASHTSSARTPPSFVDYAASAPTQNLAAPKPHAEGQGDCAEDECLGPDQCGNESAPPKPENLVLGVDKRPLLPLALGASTVVGMMLALVLELPLLGRLVSGPASAAVGVVFLFLYCVTLGCMAYSAFSDPGQLRRDQQLASPPKRAYKSWQFKRPVRRYDHYCRWLSNCVGLLNHREFVAMLVGLVLIGGLGVVIDVVLTVFMVNRGFWDTELAIIAHLAYSVALLALAGPILRIHAGLVSRNELASEWKKNDFYVAKSARHGDRVPVNDLSDEEFNSLFDSFIYDPKRNPFDRGLSQNCLAFWCVPRWAPDQLGEF